jgi:DNA-binding phage protein
MATAKNGRVRNPNGRPPKWNKEQVAEALLSCDGNLTAAAARLGVVRKAVYDYIERYNLKDVLDQSREKMADEAVGQLHRLVRDGNLGAVIFYLKTQAKSRGFTERIEQTGANGEPIEYRQIRTEGRPGIEELKTALNGNRVAHLVEEEE